MWTRIRTAAAVGVFVIVGAAATGQGAWASITPTLTLDQSAGTQAGSTANLGMDLKFSYTGSDSPQQMTIELPPGLLANAAMNGGACLTKADITDTNCQVGTGTVTADPISFGLLPISMPVTFDLVPPPAPGDLGGLAVISSGAQLGATGDIRVRPSGDPDGVGITISLTLPDTVVEAGLTVPISIVEINSTFDGLRYPTTCPATPAKVSVGINSYSDTTVKTVAAPLSVTGCSSLTYSPTLAVSVTKDSGDRQVGLSAAVTQLPSDAPSKSLSLAFAGSTLGVNLGAAQALCSNVNSGSCKPIGSATAVSPLYPKPLTANAYLTGAALQPTLTLVFPAPFPLTLVGTVTLVQREASFTGLPDIPLTSLSLTLNGGATGLFQTNCSPITGKANASSTDQNGDKTVASSVAYAISGCPGSKPKPKPKTVARPKLSKVALSGLKSGHPKLSFRIASAAGAPKLTALTVTPPAGLKFVRVRVGRRLELTGIALGGGKVKSLTLSGGHLVIRLLRPAAGVNVTVTRVLTESGAVVAKAQKRKLGSMRLSVATRNAKGKLVTVSQKIAHPRA
jgi:hypothetical protein